MADYAGFVRIPQRRFTVCRHSIPRKLPQKEAVTDQVKSEDGILDLNLALPKALGGNGGATNPEQLFAAGYAACFENALLRVSREARHHFSDDQVEVVAEIGISRNEQGNFVLSAALAVTMAGVDQATAEEFVHRAHQVCPYSNAIRGNVDVATTVTVR